MSKDSASAFGPSPSCGDLGDLPAGAVLTTVASVSTAKGGEACFNVLVTTPRTLTTGTLDPTPSGTTLLRLPGGCTGEIEVYFQSSSETSSFLDPGTTGGQVRWWLIRRFRATGDSSLCFPPGATPRMPCTDAFVAENVRR